MGNLPYNQIYLHPAKIMQNEMNIIENVSTTSNNLSSQISVQLNINKKKLIMNALKKSKSKKNLFESLSRDRFPVPTKRVFKFDFEFKSEISTTCLSSMFTSPESLCHGNEDMVIASNLTKRTEFEDMMADFLGNVQDKKESSLKCDSKMNNLVIERVISFKQLAAEFCKNSLVNDLEKLVDRMVQYISEEHQIFKGYKSDAIADSILLIVQATSDLEKMFSLNAFPRRKNTISAEFLKSKNFHV